jgi:ketosteroid isomerase-like protein
MTVLASRGAECLRRGTDDRSVEEAMSESAVESVRGMYDAFKRGDVPAILAALDEDIEWSAPENLPHGGDFRGRDAVGGFFQGIGEKWDGLEVEVEELLANDNHVVALIRADGRLRESGEATGYTAAHAWTMRGDTPIRFTEYVSAPLSLPAAR